MLAQLLTSFVATGAFGILFNVPRNRLFLCGLTGMLGWLVYYILTQSGIDAVPATLAASFSITVLSQFFAKWFKTPIIVFSVSGIIPLVPGGMSYDAMRLFVGNDYGMALQLAAKAFLISGAIAVGLIFSEVANQIMRKPKRSGK
ncbi:threonine/serine exporter family protein [Gorillibacterium massiliense]|uniref:threonine/serine exporter family protein n=1 Tax=Gorillibacterium massiliense TaxID=1280390 RepID=UPI0004B06A52|nr:threonine/serine exporter family protein [Gorillibacterium massiliense]